MKKNDYSHSIEMEELLEQMIAGYCTGEDFQKAIDTKVQLEQYSLIADLTESIHSLLHLLQNSKVLHRIPQEEQSAYQEILENICSVAIRGQNSLQHVEELEDMAKLLFLPEATATLQ